MKNAMKTLFMSALLLSGCGDKGEDSSSTTETTQEVEETVETDSVV